MPAVVSLSALVGELDIATAPALEEAAMRAWADGAEQLVLDCSGLDFIDSTGLHTILRLRRRAVRLSVVHASAAVRRVFEVTGVPLDDAEGAVRTSTAA